MTASHSPKPTVTIRRAQGTADVAQCLKLRAIVFGDEQGIPLAYRHDDIDQTCHHLLAYATLPADSTTDIAPESKPALAPKDVPAGTLRFHELQPGLGNIAWVTVLPQFRSLGIGRLLMQAAHQVIANELMWSKVLLYAQCDKTGFYTRLGYTIPAENTVYLKEGNPHINMELTLADARISG
ncbi:hypothetical protein H4R34_000367 [Dimargaris verticillata]|uniref:N-acetyltransferase domain-containing protein n=1 Tax=Dimargaris verticillata TaxID=2761393 RepID=A0A9W8B8A7_9FUNG|nr:hypothetical protein H4R34_000367 [Dimargaris verticillata]